MEAGHTNARKDFGMWWVCWTLVGNHRLDFKHFYFFMASLEGLGFGASEDDNPW